MDNKHMTEPWLDQALMDSAELIETEAGGGGVLGLQI